ncbi:hypothetical protein D9C73_005943 [Collichthys lucidus]|uniref:Integrase core domain-containing protein n=1 Tax=Collichthys lucidus TaxID=240159 RepID=A0A4U5U8N7_COLLU|nr:hypothetical protein D9C73_005943 [Collichthys lucidus]
MKCGKCNRSMYLEKSSHVIDGLRWICKHHKSSALSVRKGSIFARSHTLAKWLEFILSTIVGDVETLGGVTANGSLGCWRLMVRPEDLFSGLSRIAQGRPLSAALYDISASVTCKNINCPYCTSLLEVYDSHDGVIAERRLKDAGLTSRINYTPIATVQAAISEELKGSGQLLGYRAMWQILKQNHSLVVRRDDVMRLMAELDPCGAENRSRRRFVRRSYHSMGPNKIWHVNGYDKLTRFGISISGCIDGFSRKMMWLYCGKTNNDP